MGTEVTDLICFLIFCNKQSISVSLWLERQTKEYFKQTQGTYIRFEVEQKGGLSSSWKLDITAIVWDVEAKECKQKFEFHSGPTLDVDWRNNVSFATSSR
ncbi:WD40 repeat-containing protein HOS15 [Camellia lanceoleosa]|nr:WD40 repeat-containing protein HOS15 [Camellia lanceoleosa]